MIFFNASSLDCEGTPGEALCSSLGPLDADRSDDSRDVSRADECRVPPPHWLSSSC